MYGRAPFCWKSSFYGNFVAPHRTWAFSNWKKNVSLYYFVKTVLLLKHSVSVYSHSKVLFLLCASFLLIFLGFSEHQIKAFRVLAFWRTWKTQSFEKTVLCRRSESQNIILCITEKKMSFNVFLRFKVLECPHSIRKHLSFHFQYFCIV